MRIDVLVAHPHKHHVYPLAAGCQRSGLAVRLLVPFYRKGLGAAIAWLPGSIGRRAQGYRYSGLDPEIVISPLEWQIRRLLSGSKNLQLLEEAFDAYVARQLRSGAICPRIFISMQDYMPLSVAAAKCIGATIWSDQISNQSEIARERIRRHSDPLSAPALQNTEERNDAILAQADIVTVPSVYTMDGVAGRVSSSASLHRVPYGARPGQFNLKECRSSQPVRVVARANSIRKGGHLFLGAIRCCGEQLAKLAGGRQIEIVIIGELEPTLRRFLDDPGFPTSVRVRAGGVPHSEMQALLDSSDLFVMPALSESMSLMCIEAMQAGLPSIITPFCGVDCFRHLEMGVQINDDADSMLQGLIEAFRRMDEWPNWGARARAAVSDLTWDKYESSIARILCEFA